MSQEQSTGVNSSQTQEAWATAQYGQQTNQDPARIWGGNKYPNNLRGQPKLETDKDDYNQTPATLINDYQLHQLQILQVFACILIN